MPIIFFTQLLGVALGIDLEKLGFGKEIVAAGPVIEAKLAASRPARRTRKCERFGGEPGIRNRTRSALTAAKGRMTMAEKVGVYVCHCGSNIAGKVDVEEVAKWAGSTSMDVVVARDYKFMCSDLGQKMVEDDIKKEGLTPRGCGRLLPPLARKDLPPRLLPTAGLIRTCWR